MEVGGTEVSTGGTSILWIVGAVDEKGKVSELRLVGTVGVLLDI